MSRIVLFGATGYTGRLTAEAMVRRGLTPVLAARSRPKLEELAGGLGAELQLREADVAEPATVSALVERGDVLVSTVGPFLRYGHPAVAAAVTKGAHYLDSTGEPPFIREVFERYGPPARKAGCGLLTAFGYDFVPGNLVGALALERAGDRAVRADVGYFITGSVDASGMSGGTRASLAGVMGHDSFAFRDGRIRSERSARRVAEFQVGSKRRSGISIGCSEHFGLPRVAPQLREVNAYLGWFGPASRAMQVVSAGMGVGLRVPGAKRLYEAAAGRLVRGSSGGPDAEARSQSGSHVVGIAYDANGGELAQVHLTGADGYTFTGEILAWGAERAAAGGLRDSGALGPVDGFGLDALRSGCDEAGLRVEGAGAAKASTERASTPA